MDKLEKTYKDKLTNYQSPISDVVWENVAASLTQDKKNYRIYFLLFFIGIIVAGIIGSILLYNNKKQKDSFNKKVDKTHVDQHIALQNDSEISNSLLAANSLNKESNNAESDKTNLLNHYNHSNKTVNKIIKEDKISNSKLSPNNYSKELNSSYKRFSLKNSYKNNSTFKVLNAKESKTNQININNIFTREKFDISLIKDTKIEEINLLSPSQKLGLNHNRIVKSRVFQDGILNDCFPTKINSWLLEFYLSPDYANKNLQGNNTAYLKSRLNTEYPILSYSTGVRVGYLFNNGAVLKSGLNYSSINERFHIIIENVISTQTVITIDTIRHSDGTYSIKRDTSIHEKLGIEDIQKMTSYKMVGIPLIAGFEFRRWNHNFGINTGLIFNLITYQKGYMLNSNGDIEQFGNDDNKIFQNNLGISFYASVFYSYRFKNHFELFVEPKIRYYLKSFTLSNYPLEQKYTKYGISFGGRYIF